MKFFKKCSTLLLALMLTLPCAVLGACGDDNGNSDSDNNNGADTEIVYSEFTHNTPTADNPAGSEYNRYQGAEGYYEIELSAGKTKYYSFRVSQAGQYALVTLAKKDGITIERCDASEHYIAPTTYPATLKEDGTLYSPVHCSTSHFNTSWRATYKITSTVDGIVKVRFYREGDPLREPERIETKMTATEIVGKAQDSSIGYEKTAMPWTTQEAPTYFYDKDYEMTFTDLTTGEEKKAKGFYRYGKPGDSKAPVIWVAITSIPDRLFESVTFANVHYQGGNSLIVQTGTANNGDYLLNNYVDFIMNNGGESYYPEGSREPVPVDGDNKMLCYMNVTNSDGLYPVNKELYDFLNYYTNINAPVLGEGVSVSKNNYWLAPCYYYKHAVPGTASKPFLLSEGDNAVALEEMKNVYYGIEAEGKYTLVGTEGLILYVNGKNYGVDGNGFTVTLEIPKNGLSFILKSWNEGEYTLNLTKVDEQA